MAQNQNKKPAFKFNGSSVELCGKESVRWTTMCNSNQSINDYEFKYQFYQKSDLWNSPFDQNLFDLIEAGLRCLCHLSSGHDRMKEVWNFITSNSIQTISIWTYIGLDCLNFEMSKLILFKQINFDQLKQIIQILKYWAMVNWNCLYQNFDLDEEDRTNIKNDFDANRNDDKLKLDRKQFCVFQLCNKDLKFQICYTTDLIRNTFNCFVQMLENEVKNCLHDNNNNK